MIPSPSPHLRRFELSGDHKAAIVLERLTYWWPRGTRRRLSDVEWLCKPRGQLAMETGLSLREVIRSLEILKAKHLIETTSAKWSGSVGPVMHFRLLPRAMVLLGKVDPEARNTPQETGSVCALQGNNLDHMAGMVSKNPYGLSNESPTEFLDADALSTDISGMSVTGPVTRTGRPTPWNTGPSAFG